MRHVSALALLLLAACSASPFGPPPATGEAQIALGSAVELGGLTISFDRVVEDSRCPEDAECVWAGEATVALTIQGDPQTLTVADPDRASEYGVRLGDVLIATVDLVPYPRHEDPSEATPVVTVVVRPPED